MAMLFPRGKHTLQVMPVRCPQSLCRWPPYRISHQCSSFLVCREYIRTAEKPQLQSFERRLLAMILLEYPLSRPISVKRRWLVLIIAVAICFVLLTTMINIIAVGYELVSFTSTTYNEDHTLWYERLISVTSWLPRSRACDGTVIKLMERQSLTLFQRSDV
jgi:hypothetical protein